MPGISRRELLIRMAAAAGAVTLPQFLAGCTSRQNPTATHPSPTEIPTLLPPTSTNRPIIPQAPSETPPAHQPTAVSSNTPAPLPSPTPGKVDLVVVRKGEPEAMVRKAIDRLGGINIFIKKGAKVIIKPNICVANNTYEYAATTNPWVVAALVKLCFEAGAGSVRVMDQPFGGTAKQAYAISGIEEQVKAAGGEMVVMAGYKYAMTAIPQGKDLKSTALYDEFLKADAIINVPIAKTHNLARLTLGMKNLMGIIDDRPGMHRNIGQRLADLSTLVKPTLNIIDAVRILTANGPTGGSLDDVKKMDTIIASADIVAADCYATRLFDMRPEDLSYITAGAAMKIGRSDLNNLKIEEINLGA